MDDIRLCMFSYNEYTIPAVRNKIISVVVDLLFIVAHIVCGNFLFGHICNAVFECLFILVIILACCLL